MYPTDLPKILITDQLHPLLQQGLEQDGFTVDYRPDISAEEVLEIIPAYEGLVINSKVYAGKELIDRAPKLKFICRAGSGLEVIDTTYAAQKNIAAFNSPEGNRTAVAEHALGMLLNLMNHISIADAQLRNYEWKREENRGNELTGKTVGIIAYGHNAQAFAKVLQGFDVQVRAYDKYLQGYGGGYVKEATLAEIFESADVLSLHLPLTDETKYMIDYNFLSSFKKPVWFVNISRGKVLHTADLLRCLTEGKIKGAALDVFENEKLSTFTAAEKQVFDALLAEKRVLLTPHIAGWTHESKQKIAEVLLEKIRKVYQAE
jgi:D-3-phosphoglycerate dehydrogenase